MSAPDAKRLPIDSAHALIGWDIGGAHVKACLAINGEVLDVAQWACPLWQGLVHLEQVFAQAGERWPGLASARHAVTMTGEMVDLFAHREDGVQRIATMVAGAFPELVFFAGRAGWCVAEEAAARWPHIASANWLATAQHAAMHIAGDGVLIDIGSTTTDLIVFKGGEVQSASRSDAERLASGELVYHGVVRTPLCALARRIAWRGQDLNVMNEFFATVADVYRLTGELNPAHDLHPAADAAAKDGPASARRIARMIGLDDRDATSEEWLAFAREWRACQVAEIGGQLARVIASHGLAPQATVVGAGCGAFLVPEVVAASGATVARCIDYGRDLARVSNDAAAEVATWAQVCAPSVAVAMLAWDRDPRPPRRERR